MVKLITLSTLALSCLTALASGQTLLQVLTGTIPAGKAYNLTTLQTLVSPTILGTDTFNSLAAALGGGANLTVFAPTDDAFTKTIAALGGLNNVVPLAPQVLSYHVSPVVVNTAYLGSTKDSYIPTLLGNSSLSLIMPQVVEVDATGSGVVIYHGFGAGAKVVDTIAADNGVIHVVDSVLIPPSNASTTIAVANAANITGVSFKSLAAALTAKGLLTSVDTVTPITIFAPVDSAFEAVTKLVNNATLLDSVLATVLKYHVIAGAAAYQPASGSYATLQGENVTIVYNSTSYGVTVNGNPVLDTVLLTNGVVHVLGSVLVPPTIAKALPASNTTSGTTSSSPAISNTTGTKSDARKTAAGGLVGISVLAAAMLML